MPISNGFGRGINKYFSRKAELADPPTRVVQPLVPVYKTDYTPRQVFEVYESSDVYLPPDRATEEKLVIVKPVKIQPAPSTPTYKPAVRRRHSFDEQQRVSRVKCCRSVYEVDECQCLDCTNGKCCRACAWLGTMCSCPVWFWILLSLLFLGLLGALIAFMVQSPLLDSSKIVYRNVFGLNSYISRINTTVLLYGQGPCQDTLDPDLNDTSKILLCNQTTTRVVLTNREVYEANNQVRYNKAAIFSAEKLIIAIFFFSAFLIKQH